MFLPLGRTISFSHYKSHGIDILILTAMIKIERDSASSNIMAKRIAFVPMSPLNERWLAIVGQTKSRSKLPNRNRILGLQIVLNF